MDTTKTNIFGNASTNQAKLYTVYILFIFANILLESLFLALYITQGDNMVHKHQFRYVCLIRVAAQQCQGNTLKEATVLLPRPPWSSPPQSKLVNQHLKLEGTSASRTPTRPTAQEGVYEPHVHQSCCEGFILSPPASLSLPLF